MGCVWDYFPRCFAGPIKFKKNILVRRNANRYSSNHWLRTFKSQRTPNVRQCLRPKGIQPVRAFFRSMYFEESYCVELWMTTDNAMNCKNFKTLEPAVVLEYLLSTHEPSQNTHRKKHAIWSTRHTPQLVTVPYRYLFIFPHKWFERETIYWAIERNYIKQGCTRRTRLLKCILIYGNFVWWRKLRFTRNSP